MNKRLLIVFVLLGLGAGGYYFTAQDEEKPSNEVRQQVSTDPVEPESVMDLALKGIDLLQGEMGEEQWKLKAELAYYSEEDGVIQVSNPEITYYLKSDSNASGNTFGQTFGKTDSDGNIRKEDAANGSVPEKAVSGKSVSDKNKLVVSAGNGVVNQTENSARLWDNVVISQAGGTIQAEVMVYDGKTHTLNMNGPVRFNGPELFGTASDVIWDLNTSIVRAESGVSVKIMQRHDTEALLRGESDEQKQ